MKPQITAQAAGYKPGWAELQRSCGMKPQITVATLGIDDAFVIASKELRHEAADHVPGLA